MSSLPGVRQSFVVKVWWFVQRESFGQNQGAFDERRKVGWLIDVD